MSDGTAAGVAKARHVESLATEPIVNDPYAQYLYCGASVVSLIGHSWSVWLFDKIMPGLYEMLVARTKIIDDLVMAEAEKGCQQVVILGAGYDMRGFRLPLEIPIFEVDQPSVQARKRAKVASIPQLPPRAVHYVPVDFAKQSLAEELIKVAEFRRGVRTLVIMEGVSQYIPRAATETSVRSMDGLCGPGSAFFLSYVDAACQSVPQKVLPKGQDVKLVTRILDAVRRVGEPWISFFEVQEMPELFEDWSEFRLESDISIEEIKKRFPRDVPPEKLLRLERYAVARK